MKPLHFAFLMLINVAWGFNIVPIKLALMELDPLAAAVIRFAFLLILCSPALRWVPGRMGAIIATGLVMGALQFSFMNVAYGMATNVSALAISSQLWVPFSLILAIALLGERIRWIRTVGIALAFSGIAYLSFDPHVFSERLPLALMVISSFAAALGTVMVRRLTGISPLNLQAWISISSIPPLALLSLVYEPGALTHPLDIPLRVYGYLLFAAGFSSVVGHAGLAWLLQRYPVTIISPFTLLSPLLAVLFSVWVFDNVLTEQMIIGGVIALVGVAIITFRGAQKQEEQVQASEAKRA
ncbi:DMT family transporter [Pedomonas mirosovicensis]|uniref:DMT family transporter n=1 Tax=Pedomonas mirosovicensis TaxID=2908641 RepID=UPI002168EE0C|nr:DMT family transporter [Pedomonas mirosovicensis]MCH8684658.1 DMT family transporter [Pedomonas mirosovicensis]